MNRSQKTFSLRLLIQLLLFVIVTPLLPLLISWRWNWWEAWLFAGLCILNFVASRALVARRNPDLIAERARFSQQEDAKSWDKVLAPLVALGGGLVPLAAGLEERLVGTSTFGLPLRLAALAVIVASFLLGSYALIENRFFSGMVRIQAERGQQVVSSGPYGWMRHPGYAGALWFYLAAPVFLDSAWAFLPAVLLSILLVIRTRLEDQTLQNELPGYRGYAQRVRYRLLPGVW